LRLDGRELARLGPIDAVVGSFDRLGGFPRADAEDDHHEDERGRATEQVVELGAAVGGAEGVENRDNEVHAETQVQSQGNQLEVAIEDLV